MNNLQIIIQRIEDLYRKAASQGGDAEGKINDWDVRVWGGRLWYRSGTLGWRGWTKTNKKALAEILVKYCHRGEVW